MGLLWWQLVDGLMQHHEWRGTILCVQFVHEKDDHHSISSRTNFCEHMTVNIILKNFAEDNELIHKMRQKKNQCVGAELP